MKRFKFRLERVLKAKEAVQSVRQVELAGARSVLNEERRRLISISEAIAEQEGLYRERAGRAVEPFRLSLAARYVDCLVRDGRAQELEVEKARDQVEICRQRLLEARQDTRVLERLREKRRDEYIVAFFKEEQANLDEVGGSRFVLTKTPGGPATDAPVI